MAKKSSSSSIPITSIKHQDTRANIPTNELRDFVADDERSPKTILYPSDPSLDPQLVWKGKDEQDLLKLSVEVSGQKRKDKAVKVATTKDLWIPAINNHGGFGRWEFLEVTDPWNPKNVMHGFLKVDKDIAVEPLL